MHKRLAAIGISVLGFLLSVFILWIGTGFGISPQTAFAQFPREMAIIALCGAIIASLVTAAIALYRGERLRATIQNKDRQLKLREKQSEEDKRLRAVNNYHKTNAKR